MCPLGYHPNGFVATHAIERIMYGHHMIIYTPHDHIYIYIHTHINTFSGLVVLIRVVGVILLVA